jgi:DNA replication protein DnaC
LCIDEVGYLSFDDKAADLLYEVINRRYERKSVIVTTNLLCGALHKRFNAESSLMLSPDSDRAIFNQLEGFSLRITPPVSHRLWR